MGIPVALTIAGSDSSGGAGIQADLRVFAQIGVFGTSAVTALTAQNAKSVGTVFPVPAVQLQAQLLSILSGFSVAAAKIGMLATVENVKIVSEVLRQYAIGTTNAGAINSQARGQQIPLIIDPVFRSSKGAVLLDEPGIGLMVSDLIPLADLLTPNIPEAATLLGCSEVEVEENLELSCKKLLMLGPKAVIVKGGHMRRGGVDDDEPSRGEVVDVYYDGKFRLLKAERVSTRNLHGTGCTFSAAITAYLALGKSMIDAVDLAKLAVTDAIAGADELQLVESHGPLNHWRIKATSTK